LSEDKELERLKDEMMKKLLTKNTDKGNNGIIKHGEVVNLNTSNFDQALKEPGIPLFVDFWAEWCAPCRMMEPIIERMANEYKGSVLFAKVNVDRNQSLARRYGVLSIPNFVIFKNGEIVDRVIGAVGRQTIDNKIRKHI
jgi:thioredoxin 1